MTAFNTVDQFLADFVNGVHNFGSNGFKWFLTSSQPNVGMLTKSELSEIASGFGYIMGGVAMAMSDNLAAGIVTVFGANIVVSAGGGSIGPFQFAVLYNVTAPSNPLIGWVDYGSSILLASGQALSIVPNPTQGLFSFKRAT